MELAVQDVEAVEAHLGLHDRCITYTRAIRQHRRAVARYAHGVVVELLLFRTATAGSHVTVSAVAVDHCDPYCGHERSTTRIRLTLVRSSRPPPSAAVVVVAAAAVVLFVAVACCVARAPRQMARCALKQLFHHPPSSPFRRPLRAHIFFALLQYDPAGLGTTFIHSFIHEIVSAGAAADMRGALAQKFI